jgi:hypothetical protein
VDDRCSLPGRDRTFFFSVYHQIIPVLGPTEPSIQLEPDARLLGITIFFLISHGVFRLSPLGTSATDDCEDGQFGRMKIGRGNRSTRRKPAQALHCPTQILLYQTWARTRAAAVGSQRLTV